MFANPAVQLCPMADDDASGQAPRNITRLLQAWSGGDADAFQSLLPHVYDDLHHIAARLLRFERCNHTLETTGLLHEAYLRLVERKRASWHNRAHFFAVFAQQMRRVLVDYARKRNAAKRGSGSMPVSLDEVDQPDAVRCREILALDEALAQLHEVAPEQSHVVELRYFGGFTNDEIAVILGLSPATVGRRWRLARAWLYRDLRQRG